MKRIECQIQPVGEQTSLANQIKPEQQMAENEISHEPPNQFHLHLQIPHFHPIVLFNHSNYFIHVSTILQTIVGSFYEGKNRRS